MADNPGASEHVHRTVSPQMRAASDKVLAAVTTPGSTLALDQLIANKPAGLIRAQRESFYRMHERLLELGWSPDRLVVNPEAGCISAAGEGGPHVLFLQVVEDQRIRETFRSMRETLPPDLRIHSLPLDRVGALATLDLQGFAGFAPNEAEDFVAISCGMMKLGFWGLTVAKAVGQHVGRQGKTDGSGVKELPQSWWRESLRPLAFDILGCTVDPQRVAAIVLYDMTASESSSTQQTITTLMRGFVVFHEIGHHERGHGGVHRARGLDREPESDESYRMEAEADAFAVEHLLGVADRNGVASAVSLVFLLFAMSPELLADYPWCHDQATHPHPLTRLVWVLRRLFPEDQDTQNKYVTFVVSVLVQSGSWSVEGKDMQLALRYVVMGKGPPPETP